MSETKATLVHNHSFIDYTQEELKNCALCQAQHGAFKEIIVRVKCPNCNKVYDVRVKVE